MKNFESKGYWNRNTDIEMVELVENEYTGEKAVFALYGWDGEAFRKCWKCSGECLMDASKETYTIRPVYEEVEDDQFDVVGYELI